MTDFIRELPYLLAFLAAFLLMDKYGFGGRLPGLILSGWKALLWKLVPRKVIRKVRGIVLIPAAPSKILKQIPYVSGQSRTVAEAEPETGNSPTETDNIAGGKPTETTPNPGEGARIPDERLDEVFGNPAPSDGTYYEWVDPSLLDMDYGYGDPGIDDSSIPVVDEDAEPEPAGFGTTLDELDMLVQVCRGKMEAAVRRPEPETAELYTRVGWDEIASRMGTKVSRDIEQIVTGTRGKPDNENDSAGKDFLRDFR